MLRAAEWLANVHTSVGDAAPPWQCPTGDIGRARLGKPGLLANRPHIQQSEIGELRCAEPLPRFEAGNGNFARLQRSTGIGGAPDVVKAGRNLIGSPSVRAESSPESRH